MLLKGSFLKTKEQFIESFHDFGIEMTCSSSSKGRSIFFKKKERKEKKRN